MTIDELVQEHKQAFHALFDTMRRCAYTSLSYSFDGSGDSGNFESEVYQYTGLHDQIHPKSISFDTPIEVKEPNGETMKTLPNGELEWVKEYTIVSANNLEELGARCAMLVLNNDGHDWYNNDGGFGEIVFSITQEGNNHIECDMNIREVTSEAYPSEAEFPHG